MKHVVDSVFWIALAAMLAIGYYFEREERRDCYAHGGVWVNHDGCKADQCEGKP